MMDAALLVSTFEMLRMRSEALSGKPRLFVHVICISTLGKIPQAFYSRRERVSYEAFLIKMK